MACREVIEQGSALVRMFVVLLIGAGLVAGTAAAQAGEGSVSDTLGDGTQMTYTRCYEQVAGFRVPLETIRGLVGSELPTGLAYRTLDPAGTIGQLNVVGLDCDQGGHEVTDVLVNAVLSVPGTALRVRTYTNSPASRTRYGLFCFGNVTTLGKVEASVEIDLSTGARRGHVTATDDVGSVDLQTTTAPTTRSILPATLQHFTVKGGQLHGRIEWGSNDSGISQTLTQATVSLDGVTYTAIGGQHVFAPEGGSATFFHRGLTRCPPGLDSHL